MHVSGAGFLFARQAKQKLCGRSPAFRFLNPNSSFTLPVLPQRGQVFTWSVATITAFRVIAHEFPNEVLSRMRALVQNGVD